MVGAGCWAARACGDPGSCRPRLSHACGRCMHAHACYSMQNRSKLLLLLRHGPDPIRSTASWRPPAGAQAPRRHANMGSRRLTHQVSSNLGHVHACCLSTVLDDIKRLMLVGDAHATPASPNGTGCFELAAAGGTQLCSWIALQLLGKSLEQGIGAPAASSAASESVTTSTAAPWGAGSEGVVASVGKRVLRALSWVHARGFVHRDVKVCMRMPWHPYTREHGALAHQAEDVRLALPCRMLATMPLTLLW